MERGVTILELDNGKNQLPKKKLKKKKKARKNVRGHNEELMRLVIMHFLRVSNLSSTGDKMNTMEVKSFRQQAQFHLGTQEPVLRLRTASSAVTSSGGGVITAVVQCDLSGIPNWASWALLFDEYQFVAVDLYYEPLLLPNTSTGLVTSAPCCVVIDYDDAAALTSNAQAMQYDTMHIWHLMNFQHGYKMKAYFQGQPDLVWTTTASPAIPLWFKFYNYGSTFTASTTYGLTYLDITIRFRQVA